MLEFFNTIFSGTGLVFLSIDYIDKKEADVVKLKYRLVEEVYDPNKKRLYKLWVNTISKLLSLLSKLISKKIVDKLKNSGEIVNKYLSKMGVLMFYIECLDVKKNGAFFRPQYSFNGYICEFGLDHYKRLIYFKTDGEYKSMLDRVNTIINTSNDCKIDETKKNELIKKYNIEMGVDREDTPIEKWWFVPDNKVIQLKTPVY